MDQLNGPPWPCNAQEVLLEAWSSKCSWVLLGVLLGAPGSSELSVEGRAGPREMARTLGIHAVTVAKGLSGSLLEARSFL